MQDKNFHYMTVRTTAKLHQKIAERAEEEGVSMARFVLYVLATELAEPLPEDDEEAISHDED